MNRPARPLQVLLLLLAASFLEAVPARADRPAPRVEPVPAASQRYAGDCRIGNEATAHSYAGWWGGGEESYAVRIDPMASDCGCSAGIAVQSVHISLWLEPGDQLLMKSRILEADVVGPGCDQPGDVLMDSAWHMEADIPAPGVYDVEIPTFFWCAEVLEPYYVTVDFFAAIAPGLKLVGGGDSTSCRIWNDWGSGWVDLSTMGFLDDLTIWTDTDCCSAPIGNEGASWGDLKARFR